MEGTSSAIKVARCARSLCLLPPERSLRRSNVRPSTTGTDGGGTILPEHRRVSLENGARRHISEHCAARTDNRAAPNRNSRRDEAIRGNPALWFDCHRPNGEREGKIAVIVRPGANVGALRDYGAFADPDGPKTIELGVIADPAIIVENDFPGISDARGRANQDAATDPRAEPPQQPPAPPIGRLRRGGK